MWFVDSDGEKVRIVMALGNIQWKKMKMRTLQFVTLLMTLRMHIIAPSLLLWAKCYLLKRQTLEYLCVYVCVCVCLCVFPCFTAIAECVWDSRWGVEVYANEIITIHSALSKEEWRGNTKSNLCFRVLFYNLHGCGALITKSEWKSCDCREGKRKRVSFRVNEWSNECIVRIS